MKKSPSILKYWEILYVCLFAVGIVALAFIAGRGSGSGTLGARCGLGRKLLVELDHIVGHDDLEHGSFENDSVR